jgi:hypothetical protein
MEPGHEVREIPMWQITFTRSFVVHFRRQWRVHQAGDTSHSDNWKLLYSQLRYRWCSIPDWDKICYPSHPDRLCGPSSLLPNGFGGFLARGKSGKSVKPITQQYVFLRSVELHLNSINAVMLRKNSLSFVIYNQWVLMIIGLLDRFFW